MRCTQYIGLTLEAEALLKPGKTCPTCGHTATRFEELPSSGHRKARGMYDEEIPLGDFVMLDGNFAFEYVQASPWSGGPCIFTALKDKDGNWIQETLHSEEEIDNA
jgi:hypothetical protein